MLYPCSPSWRVHTTDWGVDDSNSLTTSTPLEPIQSEKYPVICSKLSW